MAGPDSGRDCSTVALTGAAASPQPERTVQERFGHPASARLLIIHADDFGMSHSVSRATSQAFREFLREQRFVLVKWKDLARAAKPTEATQTRTPQRLAN